MSDSDKDPPPLTAEIIKSSIISRKPTGKIVAISRQPQVDVILDDLYTGLLAEARRLRDTAVTEKLDELDFSRLVRTSEALVKLSKEQREKYKQENPEGLTDEEIAAELRILLERKQ